MYCYKLNNSYTVYVNHVYLNECIKAGKKAAQRERERTKHSTQKKSIATSDHMELCDHNNNRIQNIVQFGSTVQLINLATKQICTWILVHSDDVNPAKQMFSVSSPIGNALIGHRIGDRISVKVPTGIAQYKILGVKN